MPVAASTEAAVHAAITRATPAELAERLQKHLGQRVGAILVGVSDAKALGRWARGEQEPHGKREALLRSAVQVLELLLGVENPETIRAWFTGMNPLLDDESPAAVFAENPKRVLEAARAFLANG